MCTSTYYHSIVTASIYDNAQTTTNAIEKWKGQNNIPLPLKFVSIQMEMPERIFQTINDIKEVPNKRSG